MSSSKPPNRPPLPEHLKRINDAAKVYDLTSQTIRKDAIDHPEIIAGHDGPTWRGTAGPMLIDMRKLAAIRPLKPPRTPARPLAAEGEAADAGT